ncbi:MAG: hypothetical protein D6729_03435 [Deltaproteobacteria bacterium]|nr:MAG: hypothetical protein D6729_03435 [Deltaproteobacteria bacterium]
MIGIVLAVLAASLSTPEGQVTLHLPEDPIRELIPTRFEVRGSPAALDALRLSLLPADARRRAVPPERLALVRSGPERAYVDYTFRSGGHYALRLAVGEAHTQASLEVQPQEWMTFPLQFGLFTAGVVLLVVLLFGLAHWLRHRALRESPDAPGGPLAR